MFLADDALPHVALLVPLQSSGAHHDRAQQDGQLPVPQSEAGAGAQSKDLLRLSTVNKSWAASMLGGPPKAAVSGS